uniref:Ig-like domain-containing protein n=1 Tax=Apteryx owenii TaxID=8824 RepID=A0A8B9P8S7_APTOW
MKCHLPTFSLDKKSMVVSLDVLPLALLEQAAVTEMPPRFAVPITDVEATEGSEVEFECAVTGTPVPVVQWFRGDICVTPEVGKYVVSQREEQGGCHSLTIENLTQNDSGEYKCIATNRAGTAETCAVLTLY